MTKHRHIISVEVTNLIRVAPDEERERLAHHYKGKALARLVAIVDNVEAGNFYEAAKIYYKQCSRDERESVGMGISAIIDGVGEREVNKKMWAERPPGQKKVDTGDRIIDGTALEYPRYALVETITPTKDTRPIPVAAPAVVPGDAPTP